ncbi:MAG TPA: iron ABC transporter permease [Acholeplasmataceae bacterium]|nr:iron ABC transporter permease [Acholeplasmataceae bacterium]HQC30690.1 iron ABC transporter permease [Acholeplasmataceae bacterium]
MKTKSAIYLPISITVVIIIFAFALMIGRYPITISDFFNSIFTNNNNYNVQRSIIVTLRWPRTLMALLVGMGLSVSGLLYQETFRNKLVSPDLLGVSAGASVGASIAIVLGLGSVIISMFSFVLGLITVFITVVIAKLFKDGSSTILLLSGVIVSGFMSSVLAFIKYFADPETTLASITYWEMGTFQRALMNEVYILITVIGVCVLVLLSISWRINLVALGREDAQTKGINYNFYRLLIIVISTLLTAISVCFCGKVSWVGLVIPHIVRLLVGRNTKKTIPLCLTFGGGFMIICDIISRTFTDSELPISAVTGLIGTVVFISILFSKRRELNEH